MAALGRVDEASEMGCDRAPGDQSGLQRRKINSQVGADEAGHGADAGEIGAHGHCSRCARECGCGCVTSGGRVRSLDFPEVMGRIPR